MINSLKSKIKPRLNLLGTLVLVMFVQLTNAQYNDRYSFEDAEVKPDTLLKDFNEDGIEDTLIHYYYAISFSSGTIAEIRNGKTGESFGINNYAGRGSFTRCTPVIKELFLTNNKAFKEAIFNEVFNALRIEPDPSLEWLLTNRELVKEHPEDSIFDKSLNFSLTWHKGPLTIPKNYTYQASSPCFNDLPQYDSIIYSHYGFHHMLPFLFKDGSFKPNYKYQLPQPMHTHQLGQILVGNNSIAIENDSAFAWLYIADSKVTDSPGRLTAPNIHQTLLWEDYLIIVSTGGAWTTRCYIVNLKNGVMLRFTNELKTASVNSKNQLMLDFREGIVKYYDLLDMNQLIDTYRN